MSCCCLVISHLKHSWQVLKYSTDKLLIPISKQNCFVYPSNTNPLLPCDHSLTNQSSLPLCSHQDYPSLMMWNGPDIYYILALTKLLEISWHQTHVKFMTSWMSYVSVSSCLYPHITSILIKQCLIFLHLSATSVLELIDAFGLIYTVLNKISSSTSAYLLGSSLFSSLKSSHFFLFINTLYFGTTWLITIKTSLFKSLKYPLA